MKFFQRIATPLAIVGAVALTGCLKSNQTYTIYPDGSGKVEMKQTFLGMMAQMVKSGGQMGGDMGGNPNNPPPKFDPYDAVKKSMKGKVYWSNLHAEDGADGSYTIEGTGFFEDVNQIQPDKGTISFKKNDDGTSVFEVSQEVPDEIKGMAGQDGAKLTPEQEQQQAQMKAMMQGMLAGFEMKVSVVMPGKVTSAEGMTPGEGRSAVYALTEKDVQDMMDKKKTLPTKMKVVAAAPTGLDDEIAAFKKDLAAAKVEDAKQRASADAKTDEPKKDATPTTPATPATPDAGKTTDTPKKDAGKKGDF